MYYSVCSLLPKMNLSTVLHLLISLDRFRPNVQAFNLNYLSVVDLFESDLTTSHGWSLQAATVMTAETWTSAVMSRYLSTTGDVWCPNVGNHMIGNGWRILFCNSCVGENASSNFKTLFVANAPRYIFFLYPHEVVMSLNGYICQKAKAIVTIICLYLMLHTDFEGFSLLCKYHIWSVKVHECNMVYK
jgi:hypothetical protein